MREILFRGRIKESKSEHEELNWAVGNLVKELETGRCFIADLSHFDSNTKLADVILEVDPETVCQYTGLTDKNGKKIFEGDILRSDDNKIGQVQWFEEHSAFMIWNITENKVHFLYDNDFSKIEITGNIYDNPELIGE